jgi:hypothetical protein
VTTHHLEELKQANESLNLNQAIGEIVSLVQERNHSTSTKTVEEQSMAEPAQLATVAHQSTTERTQLETVEEQSTTKPAQLENMEEQSMTEPTQLESVEEQSTTEPAQLENTEPLQLETGEEKSMAKPAQLESMEEQSITKPAQLQTAAHQTTIELAQLETAAHQSTTEPAQLETVEEKSTTKPTDLTIADLARWAIPSLVVENEDTPTVAVTRISGASDVSRKDISSQSQTEPALQSETTNLVVNAGNVQIAYAANDQSHAPPLSVQKEIVDLAKDESDTTGMTGTHNDQSGASCSTQENERRKGSIAESPGQPDSMNQQSQEQGSCTIRPFETTPPVNRSLFGPNTKQGPPTTVVDDVTKEKEQNYEEGQQLTAQKKIHACSP